ncbi:MAG TPA: class I SAM-dependent methyltransferase [Acidimicrobiia bacterium]|nr:class I SAM-dependent methyltransferase [Acidimicrobiia bacterium]
MAEMTPAPTNRMSMDEVRRRYDEMAGNWRMLGIIDWLLLVKRLREKHFASASGEVLDVGCGTGENFEYLARADLVAALDLSTAMTSEAERRVAQMGKTVAVLAGDAQQMPFPDDRFDTVISAFSSCTFPDHAAAFREMVRVTRPGGRILLLEHGRSSLGPIARRQDRNVERVYERSGCRNNRDVVVDLAEAGLVPTSHVVSHLGMMNRITIEVDGEGGGPV